MFTIVEARKHYIFLTVVIYYLYNALIRNQIIIEQKGEGFCPITETGNHLMHAYHLSQQKTCTLNKLQIQTLLSSVGLKKRALKVWVKGASVINVRNSPGSVSF
jgi:hypothetical protein